MQIIWNVWSIYLSGFILIVVYLLAFTCWALGFALLAEAAPNPVLDIQDAVPEVGRVLREFRATGRALSAPKQHAIRAVWSAIDNTRMYIRMIDDGHVSASAPNPELVALWSEASLQIAAFEPLLAGRLRSKAEYWSDPQRWDDQRINARAIGIDAAADDARALLQLAVPQPQTPVSRAGGIAVDAFLSHASEDKGAVVGPLASALSARGHTVWYDEFQLTAGDHLTAALDRGLARCRFGAVILSSHFFEKPWPQMELAGLLALETSDGRKRILPIRHGLSQQELVARSPLLGGRVSVSTDLGIPAVVDALVAAKGKGTTA